MKEHDPNWNKFEMLVIVQAKRAEFIKELEVDDPCKLMNLEMIK